MFIDSGIDKLFFTGSSAVGKELMKAASSRLLPLSLELGGADAAIIRQDANLERAASGVIWAGFSNAGQSCGGVQRVLVDEKVYEPFLLKLCDKVRKLKVGEHPESDLGQTATQKQADSVRAKIAECVQMGAKAAAASPEQGGNQLFVPATVLTNVTLEMPVMREEIFGPVVAVYAVKNDDEAVKIANNCSYGLTGSVWSKNRRAALAVAAKINAGAVTINDHLMSHGLAETPWGGFGDSGLGRTHGELGFREMQKTKVLVDDTFSGCVRDLWWQPYSKKVYDGVHAICEFLTGGTPGKKLRAIPKVVSVFMRQFTKN
jgi:succinate-semialdehyde dehydrogenase/glutarate-semialdehyde dehydrogenase